MLMEMVADSGLLRALDLVEVNPILDDRNTTAILGAELASPRSGRRSCRVSAAPFDRSERTCA